MIGRLPVNWPIHAIGFETDSDAARLSATSLERFDNVEIDVRNQDYLDSVIENRVNGIADLIIANPPYVRTQVLGARKASSLARDFQLRGRVDLYQAFSIAMGASLKSNGVLGLLTSNRFMTVQSGAAMREYLQNNLAIEEVFDLGESRLFSAAVLPMVLIARAATSANVATTFARIEMVDVDTHDDTARSKPVEHILNAISTPCKSSSQRVVTKRRKALSNPLGRTSIWSNPGKSVDTGNV